MWSNESHRRHAELRAWIREHGNGDFVKAREHCIKTYGDDFKKEYAVTCMCDQPGGCPKIHFEDRLKTYPTR